MKLTDVIKSLGGIQNIKGHIADDASDTVLAKVLESEITLTDGRLPVTVNDVRAQQVWLAENYHNQFQQSLTAVSPRQIRQALTRAGLREAVEQAVRGGGQDLKDWWEYSTAFERNNAQVQVMADALGVSAQQLDDLWVLAATI